MAARDPIPFAPYRLGTPRPKGDTTLRVGTVRFLPRGVRREDYAAQGYMDVWFPLLAPSRELMNEVKSGAITFPVFFRRYRKEMSATDARQAIELLARLSLRTPIAIGCYCEDESRCHRSALAALIREARDSAG